MRIEKEVYHHLVSLTEENISQEEFLSFDRFMSAALYHPLYGYYAGDKAQIGKSGDFFTSVSVGKTFGHLLAHQFHEIWQQLERPTHFHLIEQGAHNGQLMLDILTSCQEEFPEFYSVIFPLLIEPVAHFQDKQQQMLQAISRPIEWIQSPAERSGLTGVYYANELFDALPVTRIHQPTLGNWDELGFQLQENSLLPATRPIDPQHPHYAFLQNLLNSIPPLPVNTTTELRTHDTPFLKSLLPLLRHGMLLLIDYGFNKTDYYHPDRMEGTFTAYQQHRRVDPFTLPFGSCDLTAHVEFSSLLATFRNHQWTPLGFADQNHFLISLATPLFPAIEADPQTPENKAFLQHFHMLTHPGNLGSKFHFLAASPPDSPFPLQPSGFKFQNVLTHLA